MRIALLLLVMADFAQAETPAPTPQMTALQLVNDLAAGKWKEVTQRFDETMAKRLDADQLAKLWASLEERSGKLQACDHARTVPKGTLQQVYLGCRFERGGWLIEVALDEKSRVAGLWLKPAPWQPLPEKNDAYSEHAVEVGPRKLYGLVSVPNGTGRFPTVILVHGSGPQDGDETVGPNRPFKDLADGLARAGVAVVRYDKRTHAPGVELSARLTVAEETVDDARAAIELCAKLPTVDPKRIFVAGHSLGGMLAPRIVKGTRAAGVILLAAPARPVEELLVEQVRANQPMALPQAEAMRKQVQDPALKPDDVVTDPSGARIPGSYFLDLRGYSPTQALRALKLPVLVLQGGHDLQVRRADYDLWAKALGGRATLQLYPMLTHLFTVGDGNLTDYRKAGHVDAEVIRDIAAFVGGKKRAK